MVFEVTFEKGTLLKQIVDAIAELTTNVRFQCTEDGIAIREMDNAHVAIVLLFLSAKAFDKNYKCERSLIIGVDLSTLKKAIKNVGKDDVVKLSAMDDGDTIDVSISNNKKNTLFKIRQLEIDADNYDIPVSDYDAVTTIASSDFKGVIQDLSQWGDDNVTITAKKKGLFFINEGDSVSAEVVIKHDGKSSSSAIIKQEVSLKVAIPKLSDFVMATVLSKEVVLSMSPNLPLLVQYALPDKYGLLQYHLAPKIENDEDFQ